MNNEQWLLDNGFKLSNKFKDGSKFYVKEAYEAGGSNGSSVSVFLPAESSLEKRVRATVFIDGNEFNADSYEGVAADAVPRVIEGARGWLKDLLRDLDLLYEGSL